MTRRPNRRAIAVAPLVLLVCAGGLVGRTECRDSSGSIATTWALDDPLGPLPLTSGGCCTHPSATRVLLAAVGIGSEPAPPPAHCRQRYP